MSAESPSIGISLSGGGFRATLFHLGVLWFLHKKELLKNAEVICSVSGGSILAGHLWSNWDRYGSGEDEAFKQAAKELIAFIQSDLRGRIVRRWIISLFLRKRTRLLERHYTNALGLRASLGAKFPVRVPAFHILATNLTSGALCAFSRAGFTETLEKAPKYGADFPVGFAVAASSAFPPFFDVVTIGKQQISTLAQPQRLTDGGIYDNLGALALHAICSEMPPTHLIVSDAGASFDETSDELFGNVIKRTDRATSVLMKRLAERDLEDVRSKAPQLIAVDIRAMPAEKGIPLGLAQWIPRLRTDLDTFTDLEIRTLVLHGFAVAREAWRQKVQDHSPVDSWDPLPPSPGMVDPLATNAAAQTREDASNRLRRGGRIKLWRWFAPLSFLIYLELLVLVFFLIALVSIAANRLPILRWAVRSPASAGLAGGRIEVSADATRFPDVHEITKARMEIVETGDSLPVLVLFEPDHTSKYGGVAIHAALPQLLTSGFAFRVQADNQRTIAIPMSKHPDLSLRTESFTPAKGDVICIVVGLRIPPNDEVRNLIGSNISSFVTSSILP